MSPEDSSRLYLYICRLLESGGVETKKLEQLVQDICVEAFESCDEFELLAKSLPEACEEVRPLIRPAVVLGKVWNLRLGESDMRSYEPLRALAGPNGLLRRIDDALGREDLGPLVGCLADGLAFDEIRHRLELSISELRQLDDQLRQVLSSNNHFD